MYVNTRNQRGISLLAYVYGKKLKKQIQATRRYHVVHKIVKLTDKLDVRSGKSAVTISKHNPREHATWRV